MAERSYDSPPGTLALFARAGVAAIPGASRLPFVGGGGKEIPDLTLVLNDVSVDRDRLAAYCRVCQFRLSGTLPPTYIHILGFPLHLALMTDARFPFPAIGLVHIDNKITQHRPIGDSETLALRVRATPLQEHPRGRKFSVLTEATVDGELVWEEVSTNLRREGGSGRGGGGSRQGGGGSGEGGGGSDEGGAREREPESGEGGGGSGEGDAREREPESGEGGAREREPEQLPAAASWRLPGDLGRRYASVSGDMNPIHIHPLSARLFGFPSAIAHGMWTKARCLAALQSRLPDAYTVEVSFRRPILLPATVEFAEAGERFAVRDARKRTPHLEGLLTVR